MVGFVIIAVMFAFFTGLLCGQVFERAITAAVVGFAVLLLLLVPYAVMVEMLLLPEWVVIFPPLILFVVSWAWSRNWMLSARWGRWGRLAAGLSYRRFASSRGKPPTAHGAFLTWGPSRARRRPAA